MAATVGTLTSVQMLPATTPVPEIIDLVFAKTSLKRSFSITEYERFGLVFTKTRVYKFRHCSINDTRNVMDATKPHEFLRKFARKLVRT